MSDETPPHPAPESYDSWLDYWHAQGQPWRTEPEIDEERQAYLAERRAVTPDIERSIYPFRDENGSIRLIRADVEWLLATHENGRGPVNWHDPSQWLRRGLDLRGADLCGVNLRFLPLARLRGGFAVPEAEALFATREQREMGVEMGVAHLEGALLYRAHLEGAVLGYAHLEMAGLRQARLDGEGTILSRAHLEGADLAEAHLEAVYIAGAHLEGKRLSTDELAHVRKFVQDFPEVLPPADLRAAFFDTATRLPGTVLGDKEHGIVRIADVRWGSVNLARVEWTRPTRTRLSVRREAIILGDERLAHQPKNLNGNPKEKPQRLGEFAAAVRANRQLATALRDQGLNEDADRFAYRAQLLQREVLRRQG